MTQKRRSLFVRLALLLEIRRNKSFSNALNVVTIANCVVGWMSPLPAIQFNRHNHVMLSFEIVISP